MLTRTRLIAAELAARRGRVEITGLAYDSRAVAPRRRCSSACPASARRSRLRRRRRSRAGAAALVVRAAAGPRRARRSLVASARAAMAPAGGALLRRPAARAARRGRDRHQRQDDHRLPGARAARGRGRAVRAAGHRQVGDRRRASAPVARTTPEAIDLQADLRAMLDGGDRACAMEVSSHALELAPRRRDRVRRRDLHQPHAGPPRLPRDHGGLLPGQAPAVRPAAGRPRRRSVDQRRRPLRPAPRRRARRRAHVRGRRDRPTTAPRDLRCGARRLPLHAAHARRRGASSRCRCPGASTSPTRSARSPRCTRSAASSTCWSRRSSAACACPGRFEPVDEGQDFAVLVDYAHTPDSLENVLRAARELARRRGRARARALRVRRRRRPRPRQAPADGRDRRAAGRRRDRHLRQPALGGSRARSSRRSWRRRRGRPARAEQRSRDRRARRSPRAIASCARAGDVVVIAGKGHEQGQEFADGRKVPFDDVTVAREALRATRA